MPSYRSAFNLRLPQFPELKDAAVNAEMLRVYQALRILESGVTEQCGLIDPLPKDYESLSPLKTASVGRLTLVTAKAKETIAYGDFCAFTAVQGDPDLQCRLASGLPSDFVPAQCVCESLLGLEAGEWGLFRLGPCMTNSLQGLGTGAWYYLSETTKGKMQYEYPSTAVNGMQLLGFALLNTAFYFNPQLILSLPTPP